MKEQILAEQLKTREGRVKWIQDQAVGWGYSIELNLAFLFGVNDPHIIDRKVFYENLIKRVRKLGILQKSFFFLGLGALLKQYAEKGENEKIEEFVKEFRKLVETEESKGPRSKE